MYKATTARMAFGVGRNQEYISLLLCVFYNDTRLVGDMEGCKNAVV